VMTSPVKSRGANHRPFWTMSRAYEPMRLSLSLRSGKPVSSMTNRHSPAIMTKSERCQKAGSRRLTIC
jgi:hypothetical protein